MKVNLIKNYTNIIKLTTIQNLKKFVLIITRTQKKKIKVFYPSTIFINQKNKNFKEYVAAKLSGEKFIKKNKYKYKNLSFSIFRLPEMDTDQNLKIIGSTNSSTSLIPFIKKFTQQNAKN